MPDRNDRNERRPDRRAAEGVRIIGAEEAQKALDAGQAAGRRAEDELRYGDVPPAPTGPRPTHRFPLPDSIDPAEAVPRPPIAPIKGEPTVVTSRRGQPDPAAPTEAIDQGVLAGNPPAEDEDYPPEYPDEDYVAYEEPVEAADYADAAYDEPGAEGEWVPAEATDDPAELPTGPLPAVADGPEAPVDPEPAWSNHEPAWASPVAAEAAGSEQEAPGYGQETPRYEQEAFEPPAAGGSVVDDPWAPQESSGGGWQAAVEGLAAGAGQAVGGEPPSRPGSEEPARMPGSDEPDPYAGRGMADQPGDEPPTTVDPWMPDPDPEPQSQGWNLGEHTEEHRLYPEPPPAPESAPAPEPAPAEDRITMTGSHELPHWSEPAPGADAPPEEGREEEYESWEAIGAQARWRSEHDDWEDASDVHYLAGDDEPGGALDSDRGDRSDLYSFDEDFERLEEERSGTHPAIPVDEVVEEPEAEAPPVAIGTRTATSRRPTAPKLRPPANDMTSRLAVGVGLVVLLVIAYALGPKALLVLAAAGVVACAAETYGILQRSGFRPATLLGLVATAGLMFAGYWRGVEALPLVVALTFAATMVWYLLGIVDARPLANVAVTAMAVLWVGFFGAFAALLLRAGDGRGLFLGVVVVTVVSDIVAFLVGRQFGSHQLAPEVSPGKTVEGLVAGIVAALVVGAIVGRQISPWGGLKHGIALGILIAVLAPIGDLFESLIKRDLNVKDSGTSLGGHGGLLDRFDSLLLVLPGAYFLASYLNLIK
jgi:phosphatidate cytidylyltransferase